MSRVGFAFAAQVYDASTFVLRMLAIHSTPSPIVDNSKQWTSENMNREEIVLYVPELGLFVSVIHYHIMKQPGPVFGGLALIFAHDGSTCRCPFMRTKLMLKARIVVEKAQCEDIIAGLIPRCAASDQESPLWRVRDAWVFNTSSYGDSPMFDKTPSASGLCECHHSSR